MATRQSARDYREQDTFGHWVREMDDARRAGVPNWASGATVSEPERRSESFDRVTTSAPAATRIVMNGKFVYINSDSTIVPSARMERPMYI